MSSLADYVTGMGPTDGGPSPQGVHAAFYALTVVPDGTVTQTGGTMIRFVRTSSVAPGKLGEALAFAKQISDHIGKQYGVRLEVMMPVGGNPHRIAWRAEYANLAAMDDMQSKLMADQKYMEILSKGSANFLAGSANDVIWRTV